MEGHEKLSLGEFLKLKRKERGVSIDEIVRETNISKRYLVALEENDFDEFPAETYILGFLTSYADALEVDREVITQMFHRQMRIEQDAPIEQLVGVQKRKPKKTGSGNAGKIGAIFGIIFIIAFIVFIVVSGQNFEGRERPVVVEEGTYYYSFDEIHSKGDMDLVIGDAIYVTNADNTVIIDLKDIGANQDLQVKINRQEFYFKEGDILNIDTDNNGIDDMSFDIINIDDPVVEMSIAVLEEEGREDRVVFSIVQDFQDAIESEVATMIEQPDSIKVVGSGTGYIQYQADDGTEYEQRITSSTALTIEFEDKLELILGNAGAVSLEIGDTKEAGGSAGEVNKSIFYWKYDGSQYTLMRAFLQ